MVANEQLRNRETFVHGAHAVSTDGFLIIIVCPGLHKEITYGVHEEEEEVRHRGIEGMLDCLRCIMHE